METNDGGSSNGVSVVEAAVMEAVVVVGQWWMQ